MLVSFLEDSNHICRQPVIRDTASVNGFLNSLARIGARTVLHSFRTRVGMRSGPVALLQYRSSSNFLTPLG